MWSSTILTFPQYYNVSTDIFCTQKGNCNILPNGYNHLYFYSEIHSCGETLEIVPKAFEHLNPSSAPILILLNTS